MDFLMLPSSNTNLSGAVFGLSRTLKGATMLTNEERALLDQNRDLINFMARLKEKGVDVEAIVDITEDLIKLHDRSKQANFDLLALTTFIVEQRIIESTEVQRSCVNEQ